MEAELHSPLSDKAKARFVDLLEDVYRHYKGNKTMPKERRAYCNGYADALMTLGLINDDQLSGLIDNANRVVFGMTLKQRQYEFDIYHETQLLDPAPSQRFPRCRLVS